MTTYLLDSNVFIQAKNLHYGLDFCPAFSRCALEAHHAPDSQARHSAFTRDICRGVRQDA